MTFEEFKQMKLKSLAVTPEQQKIHATTSHQKGEDWHRAKEERLSSSQFGSSAKHNVYHSSLSQLISDKLWPKRLSNSAMEYGSTYEEVARCLFERYMKKIRSFGSEQSSLKYSLQDIKVAPLQFVISLTDGWLGFSPDGVVWDQGEIGGLEIKCPHRQKIPYYIPHAHYDQMQGTMYIAGWKFYYYVVYTPRFTLIRKIMYDETYCKKILFPAMENFYMKHYLPSLYYKHLGLIKEGQIQPPIKVPSSKTDKTVQQQQ